MNILITGAGGFIGRHLSNELEQDHTVYKLYSKDVDLTDTAGVRVYFTDFTKERKVDIVIHLAARFVSDSNTDNINVLYENLRIAESVVTIAKIVHPRKIINFSTIGVYPNADGVYSETSEIRPSFNTECLYGLSKFCGENLLEFLLKKENIIISNLRVSQVYGEGMREDRIIPIMIKELKQNNTITVYGEGTRTSNFISVEKLAEVTKKFIKEDLEGIYNIGDEEISYEELAVKLIKQYGNKDSKVIKKPEGLKNKTHIDTTKIARRLSGDSQQNN